MNGTLEVDAVSVRYGGVVAVTEMSLVVESGQIHGLIGPNGAGKTSLIDAVTGFERPTTGRVRLAGTDITEKSAHERVRAGLVRTFQNFELFSELTVEENLLAVRGSERSTVHDRLVDVTNLLGLSAVRDELVSALPHGTLRMVTVGRALMANPHVLVLDEPAAGLDERATGELGNVLRMVAREGTAILLVDHDMALVLSTCDVVTVMEFGRHLAHGGPEEIRRNSAVRRAYLGEE